MHNFVWTLKLDNMAPTEDCTKLYSSNLKRSRSPELKLAQLRKASGHDDVLTDNIRSQKRYLSQAMATDIDKLNMTVPPSPATSVSMYHSDMQTASNTSMNSGAMHDDSSRLSTPTSKRQRLSPLELPDFPAQEPCSAQAHRLSDDGRHHMQSPHDTPQAQRLKDAHDKPPVSPNDSCFGMDLRKAALLRSLMLATEGPTSCAIPQHKRQNSAQKGKGKAKGKLTQMQRMMPAPTTDSASMEVDCMSDRSSVSPDTASSNVSMAPAQCLNLPVQDKDIYSKPANGSLFQ